MGLRCGDATGRMPLGVISKSPFGWKNLVLKGASQWLWKIMEQTPIGVSRRQGESEMVLASKKGGIEGWSRYIVVFHRQPIVS